MKSCNLFQVGPCPGQVEAPHIVLFYRWRLPARGCEPFRSWLKMIQPSARDLTDPPVRRLVPKVNLHSGSWCCSIWKIGRSGQVNDLRQALCDACDQETASVQRPPPSVAIEFSQSVRSPSRMRADRQRRCETRSRLRCLPPDSSRDGDAPRFPWDPRGRAR